MQSLALRLACITQKENEQISPSPTPAQRSTGRTCWKSNLSCQIKQFMEGVSLIELCYQSTKQRGQGNQLVSEFCKPPCTSEPGCQSSHCPHSGTAAHGREQALEKLPVLQLSDAGEAVQSQVFSFRKGTHFAGASCWRSCVCPRSLLLNSCVLQEPGEGKAKCGARKSKGLEKEIGVQEPGTRDVCLLKESAARKDSSAMLLQHPFLEKFNILLHGRREIFKGLGPTSCRICSQIWICG